VHNTILVAMSNELKHNRLEHFERACRERRLPVTTQRRAIFEMILDRDDHPTADRVYDQVRKRLPTISRTTVYRILDSLVELGFITKVCHLGSAARFDPRTRQHHHLVCLRCERIIDVEEKSLNDLPWPDVRRHGFEIRDYQIHFRGVCAKCRKALAAGVNAPAEKTRPSTAAARRRLKQRPSNRQRRNKT
jgi:Fur family peroxide stress response transcriptional regulator